MGCCLTSIDVLEKVFNKYHKRPFESKDVKYVKTIDGYEEFSVEHLDTRRLELNDGKVVIFRREISEEILFFERARKL